jgi:cysteine desulfurase
MQQIYLDNNATTPILAAVAESMAEAYAEGYANPASQHQSGQRARRVVEESREEITTLLGGQTSGMSPDRLVFTSGGTESNNLAMRGFGSRPEGNIIVSAIEHPSIAGVAEQLVREGCDVRTLPVSQSGVVRVDSLLQVLDDSTQLVSVMLGNNETGVLQPVREIAAICQQKGVPMHTDAVQAVGKIRVDFHTLGVSLLSLSAHKFHGPRGIGALLLRHDATPQPLLFGGFQQAGIRPGTEPVELVLGMLTALRSWKRDATEREERLRLLRDRLERLVKEAGNIVINGVGAERLPHTSNISFVGLDRQAVLMALDVAGVACSTGSACASGSSEPSPVLLNMGLAADVVEGSIRISLGAITTTEEVDEAARRILAVCRRLRVSKAC